MTNTADGIRYGDGYLCGHWLILWTSATSRSRGLASVMWHTLAAIVGFAGIPLPRMCFCGRDSYQQRLSATVRGGYKSVHHRGDFRREGVGPRGRTTWPNVIEVCLAFWWKFSTRPAVRGLQVGATHPLRIWMHRLRSKILQNIKHQHGDQPLKNCDTLPQACFPFVEPPWLETTHFPTLMYVLDTFSSVIKRIM
jgi:hypothetical protein